MGSETGRTPVLLIHGIWMTGLEMRWLGRKLTLCGLTPHYFRYHSLLREPSANASRLQDFIREAGFRRLHLVAHSLGGIILLHLFHHFPQQPEGRVVLLGSPITGSGVAKSMSVGYWMRYLLGRSVQQGLIGGVPPWDSNRDLGVIAGTSNRIGAGKIFGGLGRVSDGTVSLEETRLPGATDFCSLNVGHMDMLFSDDVARATCAFLHRGRFDISVDSSGW